MTAWWFLDLAGIALPATLLVLLRTIESPPQIRRLFAPCFGGAMLYALGDLGTRVFADRAAEHWLSLIVLYAGYMMLPPSWWLLSVRVAERADVWPRLAQTRWSYLPAAIGAAAFAALLTNPWHGAFLALQPGHAESSPRALWFAHELAAFVALALAGLVCSAVIFASRGVSRRYAALLLGTLAAMVGVGVLGVWHTSISGRADYDPAIAATTAGAAVLAIAVASQRLYVLRSIPFAVARAQDPDALLLIDTAGFLVDANEGARSLFGAALAPPGAVLARVANRLAASEESRPASEPASARLERGIGPPGELFELGDDPSIALRVTTTWLRDAHDRAIALLLRARDVSALVAARRETAEHAELLEVMWTATGDAVWVIDLQRRIRFANDAMAAFFGMTRDRVEGRDVGELLGAAPDLTRSWPGIAESRRAIKEDFDVVLHDYLDGPGDRVYERIGLPLHRDGVLFGRLTRVRDVTDQRRSEDALRESVKQESLSVLAGGVAHDFNNLLTAMLGSAELALRELPPNSSAAPLLEDLRAAAERGGALANQLLVYSGRSARVLELVDLSALVAEISSLLASSVPRRVTLVQSLATDLCAVRGDASQLRQVAMNLVLNAAEAIGDRRGCVSIQTGECAEAPPEGMVSERGKHSWIFLRVADDGAGMSPETRARIFDPFFTTKPSGRGLGLASVRGIVAQHGGTIAVESELGRGTTFTVFLPATELRAASARPARDAHPARSLSGRMLIVDDDAAALRVSRLLAESLGFDVTAADRPSIALEVFRAQQGGFRVALIDATMPEYGGPELLRRLRELAPGLPAVVYSGFTRESVLLPDEPPTLFLAKPFRRTDLEAALLRALREPG